MVFKFSDVVLRVVLFSKTCQAQLKYSYQSVLYRAYQRFYDTNVQRISAVTSAGPTVS